LWTEKDAGEKIVLFCAGDEREEAAWVCDRMQQLCQSGIPYGDMAALYRTNAQTRVMEEMLVRAGIPYRMYGGTRFYDRKEIKDIVSYLRVLVNPADDVSLRRIINTPRRSIGDATISELMRCAAENGYSLFTTMLEPHETLASRARKSVGDFGIALTRMMALRETMGLGDFIALLVDEFELAKQYERDNSEEGKDRILNIQELIGAAREFAQKAENPTLESFLENVALVSDLDGMVEGSQAVTLMTLHSAKGLEFEHVFMIGMEQGLFPSYRSLQDEDRLEEERRLCYVGVTRAKKQLFLSHTIQRLLYNQMQHNEISQFVREIPRRLMDDLSVARQAPIANPAVRTREQIQAARSAHTVSRDFAGGRSGALKIPGVQKGFSPSVARAFAEQSAAVMLFKPGDRVLHKKFGEGNVIELRGEGSEGRVVIEFAAYGVREFVASLAPIVKVGE
ncbi:MAG TPA: 3'-5' exonuclease, partial [Clostridia bacterium]|nr:3'-5' exonuclease [Clostridia bacterium]